MCIQNYLTEEMTDRQNDWQYFKLKETVKRNLNGWDTFKEHAHCHPNHKI